MDDNEIATYSKPTTTMYKPTRNGELYYGTPLMAIHTWPTAVHKFTVSEYRRVGPWTYRASRETYLGALSIEQIFRGLSHRTIKTLLADLSIMRSNISLVNSLVATTKQVFTHRDNLTRATTLGKLNFYLVVCNRAFDGKSIPELWFPNKDIEHVTTIDDVFTRHVAKLIKLIDYNYTQLPPEPLSWPRIRARVNGQHPYTRYNLETGLYEGGIRFRKGLDPYPHSLKMPYFAPVEHAIEGSWDDYVIKFVEG